MSWSAPIIKEPPISKLPGIHVFQSSTHLFTAQSQKEQMAVDLEHLCDEQYYMLLYQQGKNVKHHQSSGFKA